MSGKWIAFNEVVAGPARKTRIWAVHSRHDSAVLGHVRWFGRWRCYAFFPRPDTVFEPQCLRDLALFCDGQTRQHRETAKLAKAASV